MDAVLVGRQAELNALDAAIDDCLASRGSTLLIEGPAGIGKTSLVNEACDRAATAGIRVASAQGAVLERDLSFGVVRQLFEPVLSSADPQLRAQLLQGAAELALPALAPGAGTAPREPLAILHGLYWLVANIAERSPLMVSVDDVHWSAQRAHG